jgi:hypothetical protein
LSFRESKIIYTDGVKNRIHEGERKFNVRIDPPGSAAIKPAESPEIRAIVFQLRKKYPVRDTRQMV